MAGEQYLTDTYQFEFGDLVLHQALKSWRDKIEFRNAVHEYLKRAGGEVEPMARKPAEFTFDCFLLGDNWRAQYKAIVDALDENNKGTLIHPLLGEMPAACSMLTSGSTPGTGRNLIEFQLSFIEDRVDSKLAASLPPTAQQKAAEMVQVTQELNLVAAESGADRSLGAVQQYIKRVENYAEIAINAVTALVINPSVEQALQVLGGLTDQVIGQILIDPAFPNSAAAYTTIALVERAYATALELGDLLEATGPRPVTRRVGATSSLIGLCQTWYGGVAALEYMELIETLNRINNPNEIPAGTELLIPPPTMELSA